MNDHEMRRFRGLVNLLCVSICCVTGAAGPSVAQQDFLDQPTKNFNARDGGEFLGLCFQLGLPCIIFGQRGDNGWKDDDRLVMKDTTPRAILDQIMRRHPDFQWRSENGVLVMWQRPDKPASQELAKRVKSLSIKKKSSMFAVTKVFAAAQLGLAVNQSYGWQQFYPISIDLKGVSVREALISIAKMEGQAVWILDRLGPDSWLVNCSSWRKKGGIDFSPNEGKTK
ncbi:MAG: hypothetical protein NTY77_00165 [Elusimicrobia bacterium]|nr:hypothetical protein [Elusimicrobiota bacterium]